MSYRRGACPALSAPMQTGDGLLVRLATAGASLAPARLIALCTAAERHGNGLVEITARGNFQIRGLTDESAAALAADIAAMELGLRDGVPVETNPLAGLDPTETANAAPLSAAIREALDATDLKSRLAPKVSVIVDGGGRVGLSDIAADVRLDAVTEDAWQVSIGGNASTARPLGVCGAADAVAAALRLLDLLAASGRDARGRDIPASEAIAELGELVRPAGTAAPAQIPARPFGHIHLGGERFAFGVGLPFGQIAARELSAFATALEHNGITEFRMSPGRALLALGSGDSAAIAERAKSADYVVSLDDPRARIFACPGSAGCASGYFAAREIAASVAHEIGAHTDPDLGLHISGCPKGCAHPAPAALTLVGTEHGPVLVENGTARQTGIPFGNQGIATRIASEFGNRSEKRASADDHNQQRPERAFAGE